MALVTCDNCDGQGYDGKCTYCGGSGQVFDLYQGDIECPRCDGEGIYHGTCQVCGGTGVYDDGW